MRKIILLLTFLSSITFVDAQDNDFKLKPKGSFFIYWGYNWDGFSKSNIHFKGNDYDFTLKKVLACDKPSPFEADVYFGIDKLTIPQYNLRIGYFINDQYSVSIGADHMKYVMMNDQTVKIDGKIQTGSAYDGNYQNQDIILRREFLLFEHTDGLNYLNVELRRFQNFIAKKNFHISAELGAGMGLLVPKTNCTLINNAKNDQFHVSGYGLDLVTSVNFTFFKYFFLQSEVKGGFIHMPDIRTTQYKSDKASQYFLFGQLVAVFGARIPVFKSK